MSGIIICGYPGIGKTTAARHSKKIIDIDSFNFSHIVDKETGIAENNKEFPINYINYIEKIVNKNKYDFILVSCHTSVRLELSKRKIPFVIVAPRRECLNDYLKRFLLRKENVDFIQKIYDSWNDWHDEILVSTHPVIYLEKDETIEDVLPCDYDTYKTICDEEMGVLL